MTRRRRIFLISSICVIVLLIVAGVAGVLVLRSQWLNRQVRARIIAEIEAGTGGTAKLGGFQFDWHTLTAQAQHLVVGGKEGAGQAPLFRADSVQLGLKVTSLMKQQFDVASLIVNRPEVHVYVYPDGSTNLPSPGGIRSAFQPFLNIKAARFELRNGIAEIRDQRTPFDIRGDRLQLLFNYDPALRSYRGHVSSRQLHVDTGQTLPLAMDFDSDLTIGNDKIDLNNTRLAFGGSTIDASGSIRNLSAAQARFDVRAHLLPRDTRLLELRPGEMRLPFAASGETDFAGTVALSFAPALSFDISGHVSARGLSYRVNTFQISGISANGDLHATPLGIQVPRFTASALGGTIEGRGEAPGYNKFRVDGTFRNISLEQIARLKGANPLPFSAISSGAVKAEGRIAHGHPQDLIARADVKIAPAPGKTPLQGNASIAYNEQLGTVALTDSSISTPNTQIQLAGTFGDSLHVNLHTTNANELQPVLSFLEHGAAGMPVQLRGGDASADLTITGALANPTISGHIALTRFAADQQNIDALAADIVASRTNLMARNATVDQGEMHVTGSGQIALEDWHPVPGSRISATIAVRGADIKQFIADAGLHLDATGAASGTISLRGTYGQPDAEARVTVDHPSAYGERFEQLRADVVYKRSGVEVTNVQARIGASRIEGSGSYTRASSSWNTGQGNFRVTSTGMALERLKAVQDYRPGLRGQVAFKADGAVQVTNGRLDLTSLDSSLSLRSLSLEGAPLGNAVITAQTRGPVLAVSLQGDLRRTQIHGAGEWRLEGDYPGRGEIHLTPITFATLHDLSFMGRETDALPFQGDIAADAVITGPLKKRDQLKAEITIPHVELSPPPGRELRAGARYQNLVLHNTQPIRLEATTKGVVIQNARLTAEETSVEASGRVTFDSNSPWDVTVRGGVNLSILQLFNRDLLAQGNAVMRTTIRGSLRDPNVNGRLELHNASLYFGDLPAGVDNANGVVTFDRNRANIERLTADVGGGQIGFGGFIGLTGGVLLYRVQGTANQVRIRYPEGISVTMNAAVNLTGTSDNGLVSGTVTVLRAALTPRADVPALLAASEMPTVAATSPNEYLRGVQFDLRLESGPSMSIQTTLGRDLQAELDLRLRGNVTHPVLSGDVSINQGEIQFFGNRYQINRCEVHFVNPTKIDPVFDVDLETRARGITVSISLAGTLNRLNMTYRSDPPLQSNEIIALLALGRDPTQNAGLASTQQASAQNNLLSAGANTLGQALTAPQSNRLQRFFGVTRLKIDPLLTGVENIPEARLTWEQQVSPDVTLTYITNLNQTSEQIVRLEWDINKRWSAIAVRDQNGVFGVDFQYRKHFK